jgi:hypothetical protein
MRKLALTFSLALLSACGAEETTIPTSDREVAEQIARGIAEACPMASPGDDQARVLCSAKLTDFKLLRDTMREPFMWGGQRAGKGYRLADSDTTRFNALVWRRMYLSLFMFTGQYSIEQSGDFIVIHLPYKFRNELDIGSYPYPFWHSSAKWDSWQLSPELVLVMEKGKLTGALRSSMRDQGRKFVSHSWSGQWRWTKDGKEMPFVSLYGFLFANGNPHVQKLDTAFRALEEEMRESACMVCHAPDNFAKVTELEFFNYPNQALYSRHSIVAHLERNTMPPKNDFGLPRGIQDEAARQKLLRLAKEFEAAGDAALAWQGELKPPVPVMFKDEM